MGGSLKYSDYYDDDDVSESICCTDEVFGLGLLAF
jgi:hypothetical protein